MPLWSCNCPYWSRFPFGCNQQWNFIIQSCQDVLSPGLLSHKSDCAYPSPQGFHKSACGNDPTCSHITVRLQLVFPIMKRNKGDRKCKVRVVQTYFKIHTTGKMSKGHFQSGCGCTVKWTHKAQCFNQISTITLTGHMCTGNWTHRRRLILLYTSLWCYSPVFMSIRVGVEVDQVAFLPSRNKF